MSGANRSKQEPDNSTPNLPVVPEMRNTRARSTAGAGPEQVSPQEQGRQTGFYAGQVFTFSSLSLHNNSAVVTD